MQPQIGERWRSPNGAEWSVTAVDDSTATLSLEVLPDGEPSRLLNLQSYSLAELSRARGWGRIEVSRRFT